jgi:hypothetical protein
MTGKSEYKKLKWEMELKEEADLNIRITENLNKIIVQ